MKIYYGTAIQGAMDRKERAYIHKTLIELARSKGYDVVSDHTTGRCKEETSELLERAIGPLPMQGIERTIYIRKRLVDEIEGDINAAIFEVSIPSTGTGIEIAHAYLRPMMGLARIPILVLYQKDYWPNGLSTMVRGISREEMPDFYLKEYDSIDNAKRYISDFLDDIEK